MDEVVMNNDIESLEYESKRKDRRIGNLEIGTYIALRAIH